MDIGSAKAALRRELRSKRREISMEKRAAMDAGILRNFTDSAFFLQADTLLLFLSCKGEPDTFGILASAFQCGKTAAVPRCLADGEMEFCIIRSMKDVRPGKYGILEPITAEIPPITEKTLCLVPGISFSSDGMRLGQGGGYYDRFLERHPTVRTVGICYSCMMKEKLPCEPHDRRVLAVVTEKTMEVCHGTEC